MATTTKFPRIPHLPWSPGGTRDDKRLPRIDSFLGRQIVITEKMDGSNLCMRHDAVYARSHSGMPTHKSFDLAKRLHAQLRHKIQPGISIFGEWCYAVHSIKYSSLPGFFLVFATRQESGPEQIEFDVMYPPVPFWWKWDMVEVRANYMELPTAPLLFQGVVKTEIELKNLTEELASKPSLFGMDREGLVIRVAEDIENQEFSQHFAKWVRKDHVQTDEHWLQKPIVKQGLR
jgi:hypothetical protein